MRMFQTQPTIPTKRIINHKVMRRVIGVIAILMPLAAWLFSGEFKLSSVSISYWTDSRDIFVGSLVAVGFFLAAYNGTGNGIDAEWWLSKLACVFALCIALFPTNGFSDEDAPAQWTLFISESIGLSPNIIHRTTSILLFICLFLLMMYFSRRAKSKDKPRRSKLYLFFGLCMLFGMPSVYFIGDAFEWYDTIFWVEWLGLWLFGFGWLTAGIYHDKDSSADEDAIALHLS